MKPVDWDEFEDIATIPDFNREALNGEDPIEIKKTFGVHVKVLTNHDPLTHAYTVAIGGAGEAVGTYIKHLRTTWPKIAGQWDEKTTQ